MNGTDKPQKAPLFNKLTLALLVLLVAAVGVIVFLLRGQQAPPAPPSASAASASGAPAAQNTDSIALPGYKALEFTADVQQQVLCLPNPAENFCSLQMSLLLEDGTLLWKSAPVPPGEDSEAIVFSSPLAAGTYENAVIHYDCFAPDGTQLNSGETALTLEVVPAS